MGSVSVDTKESFIFSDEMDSDTYGIILDGFLKDLIVYYGDNSYVVFLVDGMLSLYKFDEFSRCHVKPLSSGSVIKITV